MDHQPSYLSEPDSPARSARTSDPTRLVFRRVLEHQMLSLIEAARLHGFRLVIEGENMNSRAVDTVVTMASMRTRPYP
jgi:hypothetical protein